MVRGAFAWVAIHVGGSQPVADVQALPEIVECPQRATQPKCPIAERLERLRLVALRLDVFYVVVGQALADLEIVWEVLECSRHNAHSQRYLTELPLGPSMSRAF